MKIEEHPTVARLRSWPLAAALLLSGIVYFGLAELGLLLTFDQHNVSPVWPATGFALAAILLFGYRIWPGLAAGAFLASAISYLTDDVSVSSLLLASLLVTAASILQVVLGAFLLNRFVNNPHPFDRVTDAFKFLFLAGIVSTAAGATVGIAGIDLAGLAGWDEFGSHWLYWWLAAMSSNLVIAPLLLVWVLEPAIDRRPRNLIEAGVSLAAFIATTLFIFGTSSESGEESSPLLGIIIFPFLFSFIWASVRFGHRGATGVLIVFWIMYVGATVRGLPSEVPRTLEESLLVAQFYMVTISALTLIPSAMSKERKESAKRLLKAKEEIEKGSEQLYEANLELKKENAERERAQAELERSNKELQQFAYVASHDLQEPLRMVASFVQLLEEDYRDKLDDQAREYIEFAAEGANRMQSMIDDLLDYSRAGTRDKPFMPISSEEALAQALTDLRLAIEESGARVTHDPLPEILGDQSQIAQVFQNLIGNAIRFRGEEPPLIHVSAQWQDGFWEFSVRDNGIGIDPRHFDRIFVIFQHLNKRSDYPGTGIGLALCKRIVERHGGAMRVESKQGEGSTFYFTIPAAGGNKA